jgi:hypothetical protein
MFEQRRVKPEPSARTYYIPGTIHNVSHNMYIAYILSESERAKPLSCQVGTEKQIPATFSYVRSTDFFYEPVERGYGGVE